MIIHKDFKSIYHFNQVCTDDIFIKTSKKIRKIILISSFLDENKILFEEDYIDRCDYRMSFLGFFTNINTLNYIKIMVIGYCPYDELNCVIMYEQNDYKISIPATQKFNKIYDMCYLNLSKICVLNNRIIISND